MSQVQKQKRREISTPSIDTSQAVQVHKAPIVKKSRKALFVMFAIAIMSLGYFLGYQSNDHGAPPSHTNIYIHGDPQMNFYSSK